MSYITDIEIRNALISRAERHCAAAKTSFSAISSVATKDSKTLARIKSGENFTLETYARLMAHLDDLEAALAGAAE